MEWLFIPIAILFVLLGAGCLVLILFSLPGAWLMILLAVIIELLDTLYLPAGEKQTFGWWLIGGCIALAAIGEVLEFAASALGAKKGGGTRRGIVGAIVGGILGVFLLAAPIPILGIFIGAILGTFIGAMVGELTHDGATVKGTVKPATGATFGRVLGTFARVGVAVAIWVILSAAAFWP